MKSSRELLVSLFSLIAVCLIAGFVYFLATDQYEASSATQPNRQVSHWNQGEAVNNLPLFTYYGHLKYLEASVNGKKVRLLFTTGGGETILSPDIFGDELLQCQDSLSGISLSDQELTSCLIHDVELDLGKIKVRQDYVLIKEMDERLTMGKRPIDGIISTKALEDYRFTVDWVSNLITLESEEEMEQIAKAGTMLDLKYMTAYNGKGLSLLADVDTPFGDYWFELDNGKNTNTLNKVHSDEIVAIKQQEDYQSYDLDKYHLASLPLLGLCEQKSEIAIRIRRKTLGDGTLGANFFQQWRLTFDLKNNKLYCRPNVYNQCFADNI